MSFIEQQLHLSNKHSTTTSGGDCQSFWRPVKLQVTFVTNFEGKESRRILKWVLASRTYAFATDAIGQCLSERDFVVSVSESQRE